MKTYQQISAIISLLLSFCANASNCDLSRFRWDCDLPIQPTPRASAVSLVYCDKSYGYLTPAQFDQLTRYYRRSVNMILTVDGEFIDAPCVPARKYPTEYEVFGRSSFK